MPFADLVAQANALNAANAPGSHVAPGMTDARTIGGSPSTMMSNQSAPYSDLFFYLNDPSQGKVATGGGEGGDSSAPATNYQAGAYTIPDQYKGILNRSADGTVNIDWAALPKPTAPWGLGMQSGPGANTLKDSSLQVNDPNYGWTTPASNVNEDKGFLAQLTNATPSIIGALGGVGFGSIVGAPLLTSLFQKVAGGEMTGNLGVNNFTPSPSQILQLLNSGG